VHHSPDEGDFESATRSSARRLELLERLGFTAGSSPSQSLIDRAAARPISLNLKDIPALLVARLAANVCFPPTADGLLLSWAPILDRSRSHEVNLSESKQHSGFVPNRDGSLPTPNFRASGAPRS
jgi:hypothetical protein